MTTVTVNDRPVAEKAYGYTPFTVELDGLLREGDNTIEVTAHEMCIRDRDENLLMIIATVGAFFVGRYKEAVAAMLFYHVFVHDKLRRSEQICSVRKGNAAILEARREGQL